VKKVRNLPVARNVGRTFWVAEEMFASKEWVCSMELLI
jgi:hypothetical protein